MKQSTRFRVVVLILAGMSALAACEKRQGSGGSDVHVDSPAAEDQIEWARVEFTVGGMDCGGCAIATRVALKKLDGVKDAGSSFGNVEASNAWAVYDPTRITPERLLAATRELGYTPAIEARGES